MLAAVAETWSRITGNPCVMSRESIRLMNARLTVSAAKAQRELGVTFRPFEETLADTVAWAKGRLQESIATRSQSGVRLESPAA